MIRASRASVLLLLAVLPGGCVVIRDPPVSIPERSALDSLVSDVCTKTLVLLGEDAHHGGDNTLATKAELVKRLIGRCGFNAVYFESGVYEFADLNRRLAAGTSAPEQLADAIGGLWNTSRTIDPLVGFLYDEAAAGRIRLAGLDPQLGAATAGYERAGLADDLLQGLEEPRRSACAALLSRHLHWEYDEEHPFDAAARDSLAPCLHEAGDAALPDSVRWMLAQAALAALRIRGGDDANGEIREGQMAQLFRWHQRQSPGTSRAIVWTANGHAFKSSEESNSHSGSLGEQLEAEYGAGLASIAFAALGGAYGHGGRSTPIPAAGPESLESRAMAGEVASPRYLSKAALAELGAVDAAIFSFERTRHADWSSLFDGVVVLREEKPLAADRPPKARFVPPAG